MTKEEIIENIEEETKNYLFQAEIDAYVKGYLDALFNATKITWQERDEIEEMLNNE